jgi:hypothetical protein
MVPRRSNLDWYADWIDAVEEVFGRNWLHKKRRLLLTGNKVHPVVSTWHAAKQWLASAKESGKCEISVELACFFDMGSDLHATKGLPGFAQALTFRRLKGEGWENDVYVPHVAAMALRSGYRVSFVPPSRIDRTKTADLCLFEDNRAFFVECKKKDKYVRPADAQSAWPALEAGLSPLASKITDDYEVIIACLGKLSEGAIPTLIATATSALERGESGQFVIPEFDAIVLTKKHPPRPAGVEGAWIPAWQNPGSARVTMTVGNDGTPRYGPLFRSCLYLLDAHRSAQILSSLRDARSQIPQDMTGVIFVAVDTDGIPDGDYALYFSTLATWLERELKRSDNARVLAVVLTGGIAGMNFTPDGAFHRSLYHRCVVRNPNGRSRFVIPGEQRTGS